MGSASALAALPLPPLSPSGPISSLFPTSPHSRPLLSLVLRSAQREASSCEPSLEEENGGGGFGGEKIKKRKGRAAVVRRSPMRKPQLVAGDDGKKSGASEQQQQQKGVNERAFLLTWLGLGALILVEGIALAASERGCIPWQPLPSLPRTSICHNKFSDFATEFVTSAHTWTKSPIKKPQAFCTDTPFFGQQTSSHFSFLPEQWDSFFVKYIYTSFTPTVFVFVVGTVAYGVSKYLQNEQLKG